MQPVIINNKLKYINDTQSIVNIIREYCGSDLAEVIEDKITQVDIDKLIAEEKAGTDCEAFESELDAHQTLFRNILDKVETLQEHLKESKRLNRMKILNHLNSIESEIENYY